LISNEAGRAGAGLAARFAVLSAPLIRRFPILPSLVRFGFSTVLSASLSFLLPVLLHEVIGLGERLSVGLAFAIAYLVNFAMLRRVAFRSPHGWRRDLALYAGVNAGFRLAEFFAFAALRSNAILSYAAALLLVLVLSTIIKFFAYRRLFGAVG